MRGFVEDVGCGFGGRWMAVAQGFEGGAACAFFAGEEAVEGEALGVEAAGDEGAEGGVGAGDGEDGDAGGDGFGGEDGAGVGDAGHAGVGDYGDAAAGFEGFDELVGAGGFVVVW